VRAGLRYLRGNRRLVRTVAGLALIELAFTALIATLPVLTRRRYHSTARLAGWLLASYGAGSVAGGLLTTLAIPSPPSRCARRRPCVPASPRP
jgi:hypothetical protein